MATRKSTTTTTNKGEANGLQPGEVPFSDLPADLTAGATVTTVQPAINSQMSFDEIAAIFGDTVTDAAEVILSTLDPWGEILNGDDKTRLVGVPFLMVSWRTNQGTTGRFVSLQVVTSDSRKYVINDGSTGIMAQVDQLEGKGLSGGIVCRHGLRRSDYTYTDHKGESHPASTFYLDTRP